MKLSELTLKNENIDLNKYIEVRELVKQSMKYPDWLGDFSKDDLITMLNNNSSIWIYYLNEEVVCSMMLIPANQKSLLKLKVDLNYAQVVEYGPMFVNKKYLGYGLQYQMLKTLDEHCINNGYKYAVSTVHPDNKYSINNFIKDNFIFYAREKFKRGIRNIYVKRLSDN